MPIVTPPSIASNNSANVDRHQHARRARPWGPRPAFWQKYPPSSDNAGNTVAKPFLGIVDVIAGLAGYYKKTYAYPSQSKLCELIERHTARRMSVRTLNRHLRALERMQLIRRTRRTRWDARRRQWFINTTLYTPMWRHCLRMQKTARALFQIVQAAGGLRGSFRVSEMAKNLNLFYKKFIYDP